MNFATYELEKTSNFSNFKFLMNILTKMKRKIKVKKTTTKKPQIYKL